MITILCLIPIQIPRPAYTRTLELNFVPQPSFKLFLLPSATLPSTHLPFLFKSFTLWPPAFYSTARFPPSPLPPPRTVSDIAAHSAHEHLRQHPPFHSRWRCTRSLPFTTHVCAGIHTAALFRRLYCYVPIPNRSGSDSTSGNGGSGRAGRRQTIGELLHWWCVGCILLPHAFVRLHLGCALHCCV